LGWAEPELGLAERKLGSADPKLGSGEPRFGSGEPKSIRVNYGAMCGQIAGAVTDPAQKKLLLQRSEDVLRTAIYLNPDSAPAAHNLAIALSRQADMDPIANARKRQEAVFYFAKACQLDPQNAEFRLHLNLAREQAARAPS